MSTAGDLHDLPRVLGSYGNDDGPLLVVLGGLHGNEPAGIRASRLVLEELLQREPRMRGRMLVLTGNTRALAHGERYLDADLNRIWTEEVIERVRNGGPERSEEHELAEILHVISPYLDGPCLDGKGDAPRRRPGRVVLLDLHSTSAPGSPFVVMADTVQNRRLALRFPVPVILGLEERIGGTLLSFFSEKGHIALCVEGGQNDADSTVTHHRAAIWIALETLGLVEAADVPELEAQRAALRRAAKGLPRVVEVSFRCGVGPGEEFRMDPGYAHFDRVEKGEALAMVGRRRSRTPTSGLLLMPRYQGTGSDGYFVGRRVRVFWLRLSACIRRLRLAWLPTILPGVEKDPKIPRLVSVDPRIARWFFVELFHLFGYRRIGRKDGKYLFLRRPDAV
jgi:succinylglutamate desuccinylase